MMIARFLKSDDYIHLALLEFLIIFPSFTTALGIIGGIAAPMYPFFVQIFVDRRCGGTLIYPNLVLTSASCLYFEKESRWSFPDEVRISKTTKQNPSRRYKCEQYAKHAQYDPVSSYGLNPYDIAVIKLRECLDLSDSSGNAILELCPQYTKYSTGLALGMGLSLTEKGHKVDYGVLLETQMDIYPNCDEFFSPQQVVIDERLQVCYSGPPGGPHCGTCDGDYGSPIVHKKKARGKVNCLIGVASFSGNPRYHVPSVYTIAGNFGQWIDDAIEVLAKNSPSNQNCVISK